MPVSKNAAGQFSKGHNLKDLTGNRYGRLEVLRISDKRVGRKTFWVCKCDCGNEKTVRSDSLGKINSCGCLKKERDIVNLRITNNHELTYHDAYSRWNAMVYRCENPKSSAYKSYGGRGIKVCEEWKDAKTFMKWADENGFRKDLTLERIDVDGDYEPSNCKWIPMEEQHYNKTTSVFVEYEGERLTVMQWAHKLGIPHSRVSSYKRKGIKFESIIEKYKTTPR